MPERPEQLFPMVTEFGSNLAIGFAVVLFVCLLLIATDVPCRGSSRQKKTRKPVK